MYDSPEELLRRIRLGEDSTLELKSVRLAGAKIRGPGRADLSDELAAFANSFEGVTLFGVDDKTRTIEGIPLDALDAVELFVREICNDSIEPPLMARIVRLELPDENGVPRALLKVDVPRSLWVHKSQSGYWYRLGSSKREMPTDMLVRLGQQRSQSRLIRFDEQPVPDSSLDDLDRSLRERFVPADGNDALGTFRKLRLLVSDESEHEHASVAGVLLCSRDPSVHMPNAIIDAVRYRGTEQDSNYQLDAKRIAAPLDRQVFEALGFVRRNSSIAAVKRPARQERPQFSERAVFEAVVNAVAHRDYAIYGSKIRLFVFDDRLELYSPGAPPNSITVDSLALRQSTRNELITSLLAKCPVEDPVGTLGRGMLMEKRGDGVPIILRESRELAGREPEYTLIDNAELLLTIFAAGSG